MKKEELIQKYRRDICHDCELYGGCPYGKKIEDCVGYSAWEKREIERKEEGA